MKLERSVWFSGEVLLQSSMIEYRTYKILGIYHAILKSFEFICYQNDSVDNKIY
jgi:hypothetical protein